MRLFTVIALSTALLIKGMQGQDKINYPPTATESVVEDYFGTKVADPYRWLENDNADNTKAWVKAQNEVTFGYLEKIPYRNKILKRLQTVYNYPKMGLPTRAGNYFLYTKNSGLQNQSVIMRRSKHDGTESVFIDPNTFSKDGTTSFSLLDMSPDEKYVAVARSDGGSDWQTITIYDIATAQPLTDKLEWVKFSGAAWDSNQGFYYSRYPAPDPNKKLSGKNEYHRVYYHKLGDPQEKDQLVYEDPKNPLIYHFADVTEDLNYVILYAQQGTEGVAAYIRPANDKTAKFQPLFQGYSHKYSVIDHDKGKLIVLTNNGAPNYRLVAVDPSKPDPSAWQILLPETHERLLSVTTGGGSLFVTYLKDATHVVTQHDYTGKPVRTINLPGPGTTGGFSGKKDQVELFYAFTSFTYPTTVYTFDLRDGVSRPIELGDLPFKPSDYETKQVFAKSKDGTSIPIFIVHKKGLVLDGQNPTMLYGYGGFNVSLTPNFDARRIVLLENGGVFAMANLRGGGEYGEAWHKAGMKHLKQNVFDDFIAAAEYLIANKYTSKEKLGIQGGSNGGLLVGACMTQRPDLFKVAIPAVGVLDMLRYHKFTVGWGWVPEYGCADSVADFKYLYKYSPYHNLKAGVNYPATLILTADHDDRVVPAHSFKFAAMLQSKHKGTNPVLIRIETSAGHGAGKSVAKLLEETADVFSFLFYNTNTDIK